MCCQGATLDFTVSDLNLIDLDLDAGLQKGPGFEKVVISGSNWQFFSLKNSVRGKTGETLKKSLLIGRPTCFLGAERWLTLTWTFLLVGKIDIRKWITRGQKYFQP